MKYIVLVGRILFSFIFIMTIMGHFSQQDISFAAAAGVPLASFAVPISGIIALLGGLSIAFGYKAKWGAWLIVLFLVPITIMMHNFWAAPDKMTGGRGRARPRRTDRLHRLRRADGAHRLLLCVGGQPRLADRRAVRVRRGGVRTVRRVSGRRVV